MNNTRANTNIGCAEVGHGLRKTVKGEMEIRVQRQWKAVRVVREERGEVRVLWAEFENATEIFHGRSRSSILDRGYGSGVLGCQVVCAAFVLATRRHSTI